jgi:hypothetical protein
MRNGWEYKGDKDVRNEASRIFTFQRGLDQDYIVEVGDGFVIVRDAVTGGQSTGGESQNLVTDPTYQQELTHWKFDDRKYETPDPTETPSLLSWQHGEDSLTIIGFTIPEFTIIILSPERMVGGEIRQRIAVPTGTDVEEHHFSIDYLLTMTECARSDMGAPNMTDAEIVVRIGTTEDGTEIHQEIVDVLDTGADNISFDFIPGAAVTHYWVGLGIRWNGTPIPPLNPFACDSGAPSASPESPGDEFKYKFGPMVITTAQDETDPDFGDPVEFASPYDLSDLECLHAEMDPAESELWFTAESNNIEPYRLKFQGDVWTFEALTAIVGFDAPEPNVWTAGNWPSAVAIRQSRLLLANIRTQPATIWGSRVGEYIDFDTAGAVNPDDPLVFPLAVAGRIKALFSKKQLVVNTDVSEVVAESSLPGNALAFNNFAFPLQSEWGSSCVQPIGIGGKVLFVSPDRKKIRTFEDKGDEMNGWDGEELNIFAQDLFSTLIQELDWSDDPAYQLLSIVGNGSIIAGTYYYPADIIGFYRITTDGLIKSITVTNTAQGAAVWALIDRNGDWRLERLLFNSADRHALDSWVFKNVGADGTVTGLDHLEGKIVSIVVKSVNPNTNETFLFAAVDKTVDGGEIVLEEEPSFGKQAFVGLRYNNSFELLPLEGVNNKGTSQGTKRRWPKVFLRINDSAIPLVNGQPAKDRTPSSPMGMGEPFTSDDIEYVDLGSGQGNLRIHQDNPLISEVTAVFGRVVSGEI